MCRKCLTREMADQEELFRNLQDYIDRLEPEVRVDSEEYETRLAVCRECDMLLAGMCRVCGCYVELRAAMKRKHCPRHQWD